MEDQKPGPGLPRNRDFDKGGGLNQKFKSFPKMSKFGDKISKLKLLKHITNWGLGGRRWGLTLCDFFYIFGKIALLMPFGSHFGRF